MSPIKAIAVCQINTPETNAAYWVDPDGKLCEQISDLMQGEKPPAFELVKNPKISAKFGKPGVSIVEAD